MSIINIQGKQYTTAKQDQWLESVKKHFRKRLHTSIMDAMRASKDGMLRMDMREIEEYLEQCYFKGREDAGG